MMARAMMKNCGRNPVATAPARTEETSSRLRPFSRKRCAKRSWRARKAAAGLSVSTLVDVIQTMGTAASAPANNSAGPGPKCRRASRKPRRDEERPSRATRHEQGRDHIATRAEGQDAAAQDIERIPGRMRLIPSEIKVAHAQSELH